jgi:hypothetical protein
MVRAALGTGYEVPLGASFVAGQVFYKNDQVEEVRLALIVPDAEGFWTTKESPQIGFKDEHLLWNPNDKGRPRISAVLTRDSREDEKFNLHVSFDLIDDTQIAGPIKSNPPTQSADSFAIHTAQEMDALMISASDGTRGRNWGNQDQRGRRSWETRGAVHRVELAIERDGRNDWDFAALEKLTGAQNSDFALAMLYVVGILAPPNNLRPNRLAVNWIDLDDVMQKIGWFNEKPNAQKKEALRRQLWRYLVYGEEAIVTGQRSTKYIDRDTKEEISTRIESPIWRIMSTERPDQDSLFLEERPAPRRAEIAISKQWEPLLTARNLAQYFPLGEILGAIPPNQVSGDWARSIGLILARLWRCNPRETLKGEVNPTRRELLTHYAPKTKAVEEILASPNPKRALEYYRDALNILLEAGLIAPKGDAEKEVTPDRMIEGFGRKGWGDTWLNGRSGLCPGSKWMPVAEERAHSLPPLKPKDLKAKPKRRPKKAD